MLATRPAARTTHAVLKLLLSSADATSPSLVTLRVLNPADELVAREWRDVPPSCEGNGVADQSPPQVGGQSMHHSSWDALAAHAVERIAEERGGDLRPTEL